MPNPYVTRVEEPESMYQHWRSSPLPALRMRRPPMMYEEPRTRFRWPAYGPYQGVSFPPFLYDKGMLPVAPIMEPLDPVLMHEINGLAAEYEFPPVNPVVGALALAAAGASIYHGYKRNCGHFGWTAAWVVGSMLAPIIALPIALAQGYAEPHCSGLSSLDPANDEDYEEIKRGWRREDRKETKRDRAKTRSPRMKAMAKRDAKILRESWKKISQKIK